jgi:uncharacterized protein (DUF58 family)
MAGGATAGVYVSLDDLVRLQHRARLSRFEARRPAPTVLAGRRASRMRGRGLDFEEVRAYLPGDDVRSIDWRVTARTGAAHTRVYVRERDRPTLILVDQRLAMFYGTRLNMKSVAAAEAAALAAWRAFRYGDRVGAVVFDDAGFEAIRPHRSRGHVMRILEAIVARNRALRADSDAKPAPESLNRALQQAAALVGHDFAVLVVSDFDGADAETRGLVAGLAQHNDVVALLVHDPSARALASERARPVLDWTRELGVPVMPISTGEDTAAQIARLLDVAFSRRSA